MSLRPFRMLPLARAGAHAPRPATPAPLSRNSFHTSIARPRPTSPTTHHTPHTPHQSHPRGSGSSSSKKPSAHAVWYREIVPAMLPIFVISTTLFLSLSLARTYLSHSRSLTESEERIAQLEAQLTKLRLEQKRAAIREKRERERILPLVVERVLQRVGVVGGEEEEEEKQEEQPRLL
ncbi:hypothetical protein IAT38_000685 [Cryptococcus sp. DSM 104549]